jgi:release factor glutamine methyltransferase
VFWEPDDTSSLREWLKDSERLKNAEVLEIGCGTGLISIVCALQGARSVVASDINPAAVANATYNAELCGLSQRLKVRQVNPSHPGPFEVIAVDEKFNFIISNPPWEDAPVDSPAAYAFYDPGFKLLEGILTESKRHLHAGGRVLLAYGAKRAINRVQELGPQHGWRVTIHDTRELESLPEVFLPGMLLELTPVESKN